jgi:hypothetical protein
LNAKLAGIESKILQRTETPRAYRFRQQCQQRLHGNGLPTGRAKNPVGKRLSNSEIEYVTKLAARDKEVREHERAHQLAAGSLALSGPSYTYTIGPDGQNYAIGGEIRIDTSSASTPEESLRKAQIIERAALAPGEPSGADQAVAAAARQLRLDAQAKLSQDSGNNGSQKQLSAYRNSDSEPRTQAINTYI